jgi:hypothetical protein
MLRSIQILWLTRPSQRRRIASLAVTLAVLASGCAAETTPAGGAAAAKGVAVAVEPGTADLAPGAQQPFTATVTGTVVSAITWRVVEGAAGGTVSSSGAYVAPMTAGTFHVTAISQADPAQSATSVVTVQAAPPPPPPPPIAVSVTPGAGSALACQTVRFSAAVTGTTSTGVTWSVLEAGGGTVSATGVYTAPAVAGTYHVVATSVADSTRSASAPIAVATKVLSITGTPAAVTVQTGGAVQLIATVTTTCGSTSTLTAVQAQLAGSTN